MRFRQLAVPALLLAALPMLASAEGPTAAQALRAAEAPLRDRAWAEAAAALAKVRADFPQAPEALEAWALEARALHLAGRHREALDSCTAFLAAHGDAAFAGRMKATMADAYAALRQDADQAKVLRERAEFLTGTEHRAQVAGLYVKLGDEDFDGRDEKDDLGRPVKKKDFPKALEAYQKALEIGVAESDRLRVRARAALSFEEIKDWPNAAAAWDRLLKEDEKAAGSDPETWLVGRARARLRGNWPNHQAEARKDLREALERFPRGAKHLEILRLSAEERFLAAGGPEGEIAFEEGVQFLRRAMGEHRDDPAAPAVQRSLAEAYAGRGQWQKAAAEWRGLVQRFPSDADAPVWRDALATALANGGQWDDAVAEWRAFLSAFPNHPLWQQVQAKIVDTRFQKGAAKRDEGDVDGAIAAWRAFAEEFPTDARAPEALVEVGNLLKGRKDFEGAIAVWRGVTGRYANSPQAPRAALSVAMTLEDDLHRLDEAVKEYEEIGKKYPKTGPAQDAAARLARLRAKHLEVRGERVVGTADKPVLRVVTRNMPKLGVRVFKLSLEDYFRRKHTILGVENLQVEIVKPDATAEWKVEPYAPYALVEADRAVPVTGEGAYVVVAGDDDLTSTTLLLVSDLEVVVKSSAGRQAFAWVRNRATGAPVEGARVLASDGSTVFAEGTTDKDGVYATDTDKTARRVLVLLGAQAASSEVEPGQVFAEGWQSKVFVSTDRPVYRPGQTVKWRAIYRRANGGAYRIPAGAKGVATLRDARGGDVERKDVVANATGVFEGEFNLDGEAPLGDWSVRVETEDRTFDGRFKVLEYRKPEFTVAVVPGKPSYATGETVKATIRLRYTFGGNVVDAPVRWEVVRVPRDFTPSAVNDYSWYFQDPDALQRARDAARTAPQGALVARGEGRTDGKGETEITFPTTERDEDAEYVVTASAIDVTRRFVSDEGRIPVVRRDHWAVVSTDKRVYRPKQEVRATIVTVDANQTPVSRAGKAILARVKRTPVPLPLPPRGPRPPVILEDKKGGWFEIREEEIEVQALPVTTDAKGKIEVRLVVPGPGTFRVRWSATDARGALVTAAATIDVAGEAEDLSKDARLVAARETYTEGERAEVLLQSPVSKVKALLTFEGEKVLAWRIVSVEGPSTVLEIPIEAAYAPNVTMKVAIPAAEKLLEAEDEIVVFRYLDVSVTPSKTKAAPGEEVEFTVTTKDAAGNPVAGEVGLAIVDEAIFGVSRDLTPAIRPFFYDRKRVNRVATTSSVGTRTYGTTRETNKDLLANAEAQGGDAQRIFAQSALRLAREALNRGDAHTAVAQTLAALEADPSSWDARAFLTELRAKPDAQEALKSLAGEVAATGDLRRAAEKKLGEELSKAEYARKAAPAPATRPAKPSEGYADAKDKAADHNESADDEMAQDLLEAELADAPRQDANGVIGVGGGAGGQFGGRRGGRRNVTARGGGSAGKQQQAGYVDLLETDGSTAQVFEFRSFAIANKQVDAGQFQQLQQAFGFGDQPVPEPSLRKTFADTASWSPHVVTNDAGKASVKVTLPDNLTTWRATARGASGESLFGEGKAFVESRRDVLLRVDTPRFLVQGDDVTVPFAVHNATEGEVTTTVKMKVEGATLSGEDGTLVVPAGGRKTMDRRIDAPNPGAVKVEAQATSAQGGDRVEATFATMPKGVRRIDGRSGVVSTSGGDASETFLEVPEKAVPGATRLTVVLYPGFDSAILDALTYLELFPYGCVEQTVQRFLPAAWARSGLKEIGSPDALRMEDLAKAMRASVVRLKNLQNPDGSFGWWRGGKGDVAMTALALLGYMEAQKHGVPDTSDPVGRTANALRNILRSAPDDVQALGHWALAAARSLDEEAYQVTFRRRNEELSVPGLAWMAFASLEAGRPFDAEECVRLILARRVDEAEGTKWAGKKGDCFLESERLATALAVRALLLTKTASDAGERGMRWILARRVDGGFGTTMETAAFVGAASAWAETARPAAFGGTITVLADGAEARKVAVPAGRSLDPKDRRFAVDVSGWAPGRHALAFRLEGQGEVRWAARLETVEAVEKLEADEHGLKVERLYLDPEIPQVEGAELPVKPGYDVLRPSARPRVEPKSRPSAVTGERLLVRLTLTAPRDLPYVMIEDPLPAGFEVLDATASGPFDWQERRDDRQVFFLSRVKAGPVVLTYVLQAVHLGHFTALPARAYPMYQPEVNGRSEGHRITVGDAASAAGTGETPPTPDEQYAVAKKLLEQKKWKEAADSLAKLKAALPLRDEIVEEVEAALLRCAIETKNAAEIVRAREELVRRNPARIPADLDTARAIAAAYADVGAHGVASTLFRDLVARSFGLRTGWADMLKRRGKETEGLDVLAEAVRGYPISNATASAAFARAMRFREMRRPEGRPGKAGAPMDEEGLEALKDFLAHYAETTLADPASYALIESLRRVRDLDGAVAEATAFPKRFPRSGYVDDALYFLMDSRWQKFEAAPSADTSAPVLEAAKRLTDEKFHAPNETLVESEFRPRAWHAIGRVRHVLGDLSGAIEAYRMAAPWVEDAREALAYLTEARLDLEETARAAVVGAASFPVRYRNVGEIRFKAYPVDLQVLFAVRRTLEGLNRIDLSGIVPAQEWTLSPKDGGDHAWHEASVELPVGKDAPGVFLVVAKAGALEASTVVLKTDLKVALQPVGDKVRVHVTGADEKGVRGAYVTVSDGKTIKARGMTDGRGVFEAPGVGGRPFVVVSLGDRFAIAR